MFIDKARILIRSGEGGRGCVSFLRLKFIPFGGPNGGNGGKGGDVYFVGNPNLNTLSKFKYVKMFQAENGGSGQGSNCAGKNGKDLIVDVPYGTEIKLENDDFFEIIDDKPKLVLIGGKGGIGNGSLATSTKQTPRHSIPKAQREEMYIFLNLKLIGDIGLIGFPNAGKSSFIRCCTNSKSIVDDYQFTTIEPHLGTYENLIIVDIPGIIEGASKGKGLGLRFLSHIERCKALLMILDINDSPLIKIEILLNELKEYGIDKKIIIALNKIELLKKSQVIEIEQQFKEKYSMPIYKISIHKKVGIKKVLVSLQNIIK